MTFIESSQIIESEKFSNISDTIFAEYTSIENFEKNYKYEEVTILEKKIDDNIDIRETLTGLFRKNNGRFYNSTYQE